ncbi:MAG: single-stranded-DNA-specific exonuclease RecJ [Casimicrobiaceae bacterium]
MEIVRRAVPAHANTLIASGVHPVLARIVAARGVSTPAELDLALAGLPTYHALRGIDGAAERLADAVTRRERIVVVADYDADGATACAVAMRGLALLGADVAFVVPNRFEFGYGLTPEIVTEAARRQPRLIVTVDNGIASHEGVAAAAILGIDVLITDHHLPAATLPAPAWIVNPNQAGCAFPCKHLAGVGVMFYVLLATRAVLRARGRLGGEGPNLAQLLDLVALGTVADVVRLDQVNRTLVAQGLARIRAGRAHPGVLALFTAAGRDPTRATAYDLGFVAGPRLNAAGRLADMSLGIQCLLADTVAAALPLATELDRLNRERREVEATMQESALAALTARAGDDVRDDVRDGGSGGVRGGGSGGESGRDTDAAEGGAAGGDYTVCVYRPEWHQGVIGIVASRLKDRFHRPTVVFAQAADGTLRGSGRSIPGFHLRDALDLVAKRAPGTIVRFGGHAFAAGLTLTEAALPAFAAAFEAVAREQLSPAALRRTLESDGALGEHELDVSLAGLLHEGVWGQGFPPPVFDDIFGVTEQRVMAGKHSRMVLRRGREAFDAVLFNHTDPLPARIHAAYRPDLNLWHGTAALQLVIEHWRETP